MAKKKRNRTKTAKKPRIKPVCKFYLEGRCIKGDQCTFLHSGEAPSSAPLVTPAGLTASLPRLSDAHRALALDLCEAGQSHLFESWSVDNNDTADVDEKKKAMLSKLAAVDSSYPTGLAGYISNARALLDQSRRGVNPLEGWSPAVPVGKSFSVGTSDFDAVQSSGLQSIGRVGFVLVAGGLGERLGYGGIKIGLPVEMCTETPYIQYYIEYILAIQSRYAGAKKLPLCIMTSGDTHDMTVELLKENDYFGMEVGQVTIVKQGLGVPALIDNEARMEVDESGYDVVLKPHGHGE